jgi:hypothetical protein
MPTSSGVREIEMFMVPPEIRRITILSYHIAIFVAAQAGVEGEGESAR